MAKATFRSKPLKTRGGINLTEHQFKKEFIKAFERLDDTRFYDLFYYMVRVSDAYIREPSADYQGQMNYDPRLSFALEEFGSHIYDPLTRHLEEVGLLDSDALPRHKEEDT